LGMASQPLTAAPPAAQRRFKGLGRMRDSSCHMNSRPLHSRRDSATFIPFRAAIK
jgi:hypothetical protein